MVFSRYAKVLRVSSRTLHPNLFDAGVNLKTSLHKTASNFRSCTTSAKCQREISENSDSASSATTAIFLKPAPTVVPKVLGLTSEAPTAYDGNLGKIDEFGKQNFTSGDIVTEDDLNEVKGLPGALEMCDEDISHIAPFHMPTFNFAAYANDSPTIQELAKLGVELHKVEGKKDAMKLLLQNSFDEMKPYIRFLHDSGVPADKIGAFVTRNPYIFTQDMDDLHTRIRYLRAHKFDREMVARIVTRNPKWLMYRTKSIDEKLGHFQQQFQLRGSEVRTLTTREPRVVTYDMKHINENTFALREEMGFDKKETKAIVLKRPGLLMKSRKKLVNVFDYVHNTMGLSHEVLIKQPMILTCRIERLKQRHKYLETLGKNQYDATKPLYVSPDAIVGGTDVEFCRLVAKTTVETYNLYLKSL